LDWRHPGGPSIGPAVIRHLASRPGRRIGSLFLNPGGPGDSGVAAVTGRGEALDAMTDGASTSSAGTPRLRWERAGERLRRPERAGQLLQRGLPVPTTRAEERRYLARSIALAQRCGARNGRLPAHISTADTDRTFEQFLALCQEAGPLRPGRSRLGGPASRGGARAAPAGFDPLPRRPHRYLVDLTTPARGTVCPSDRLPFDPDFGARRSS
jgi:hypothetical protein